MGKLDGYSYVNGYVTLTLDKLSGIKSDLVRTDDNWKNCKFYELLELLKKWTETNPIPAYFQHQREHPKKDRLLQTTGQEKKNLHVYTVTKNIIDPIHVRK